MKTFKLLSVVFFFVFAFMACSQEKEVPKPTETGSTNRIINCPAIPSSSTILNIPGALEPSLNCALPACAYPGTTVSANFLVPNLYYPNSGSLNNTDLQGLYASIKSNANLNKPTAQCSTTMTPSLYVLTVVPAPFPGFSQIMVDVNYSCCNGRPIE